MCVCGEGYYIILFACVGCWKEVLVESGWLRVDGWMGVRVGDEMR